MFTANRWISLNEQELFISDVKLQYEEAVQYGRTNLSAELWVYASATQYFNVSQQFGLNGSEYWTANWQSETSLHYKLYGEVKDHSWPTQVRLLA